MNTENKTKRYELISVTIIASLIPMYSLFGIAIGKDAATSETLPAYFGRLYIEYRETYESLVEDDMIAFFRTYGLEPSIPKNKESFLKLSFFHDLFTGESATDCVRGGALQIPYFWHWLSPNPRHLIRRTADSVLLCDLPPPPEHGRYKSHADIDRVPSLYLSDLISPSPRYYHPECGSFYTFGWCSEREMAFVALMSLYGYTGKIHQRGIHVFSSFRIDFTDTAGASHTCIADVDNTFNWISWSEAIQTNGTIWQNEIGRGTTIQWYNRQALSDQEHDKLNDIRISKTSIRRIDSLVSNFLLASGVGR